MKARSEARFDITVNVETLAAEQDVSPATDFESLLSDFWPEEESADIFIATLREWRREGGWRGRSWSPAS